MGLSNAPQPKRDERPPNSSSPSASSPSLRQRWVPTNNKSRVIGSLEDRNDAIFRKARGILNRLTPEKFDKLSFELLNVGIDSQLVLKGIIILIFEKALDEPKYSTLYAQLCHRLCDDAPNFEPPSSNVSSFRRLLLSKCQDEFENRSRATEVYEKKDTLTAEEYDVLRGLKRKMLGNIKFVGELGKLGMVHEAILHKCIKQLLEKKKTATLQDVMEDVECLCQIMMTVGRRLDTDKARAWMDQYFERMKVLMANTELPLRIRFKLQDVIELREAGWVPRQAKPDGPLTIQQVREMACRELGVSVGPPMGKQPQIMMPPPGLYPGPDFFNRPANGTSGNSGSHSNGLMDIYGMPPPSAMMSGLGTGPGTIQFENFTPRFYNPNVRIRAPNANQGQYKQKRGEGNDSPPQQQYNNSRRQPPYEDRRQPLEDRRQPLEERRQPLEDRRQPFEDKKQQHADDRRQVPSSRADSPPSGHQAGKAAAGNRELPPRFRRLQEQQHRQQHSVGPKDADGWSQNDSGPYSDGNSIPVSIMQPVSSMSAVPFKTQLVSNDDVSLRPMRMFTPLVRPNVTPARPMAPPHHPMMMRASVPLDEPPPLPQPFLQKPLITNNKQENKGKMTSKSTDISKETIEDILSKFISSNNTEAAVSAVKDLKLSQKQKPDILAQVVKFGLDKPDSDKSSLAKFLQTLCEDGTVTSDHFMEAFRSLLDRLSELESEMPLVKSNLAKMTAQTVAHGLMTLAELAEPLKSGIHYPLFLLCLQQLQKVKDKEWLGRIFSESKIDLQLMLPDADRSKERMMEILEDRGLGFLFPMLRVQMELVKQIRSEQSSAALLKWFKENVGQKIMTTSSFVDTAFTTIISYVTGESTLQDGTDPTTTPEKSLIDRERELFYKFKAVMMVLVTNSISLQLRAIYSVQVFCNNNNFPKGMLLRLFVHLYEMEVIEEQAFVKWKEQVSDEYPGKGKALFQVNQWLQWLEEAEEESDEEIS